MTPIRSSSEQIASLNLIEVKAGVKFPEQLLRDMIPDVETLLFFCKLYDLDHIQVSKLLTLLFKCSLSDALTQGGHSTDLQGYVLDLAYAAPGVTPGDIVISVGPVPHVDILPEMWAQLEVTVAQSIKDVAKKLEGAVAALPGKKGRMIFKSMMVMNRRRPTLGDHRAQIVHPPTKENLVILDVSQSMSRHTIEQIVDEVVALSYEANAHMAVVSYTTTHWAPGAYNRDSVMQAAEFGGTHYETLAPLLDQDWGTVICVADYDSSEAAKDHIKQSAKGSIDIVLDVSLVNRPTYLAECLGQIAKEIRPMLVGTSGYVLNS